MFKAAEIKIKHFKQLKFYDQTYYLYFPKVTIKLHISDLFGENSNSLLK